MVVLQKQVLGKYGQSQSNFHLSAWLPILDPKLAVGPAFLHELHFENMRNQLSQQHESSLDHN
jgi:hypothetical protein